MKTKPFSELRKRMTPEQRAKNKTLAQLALLHLTLIELPKSLGTTQESLEKNLNVVQSALSQLENQEDIQVSTLSDYIKVLGGNLKLVAHFPDEEIVLAQFE
ncbi:MAG TPA: transcriptional regulator [Cyanobacteria bacterium UBA8803]|nr:transcriptional regulator [Cyanobacteria bacterium UBA9273]HBL57950.1 transcriptional regulator [Cyanobacteria bacterium UBA8803]